MPLSKHTASLFAKANASIIRRGRGRPKKEATISKNLSSSTNSVTVGKQKLHPDIDTQDEVSSTSSDSQCMKDVSDEKMSDESSKANFESPFDKLWSDPDAERARKNIFVTDVTCNSTTITFKECPFPKGFFRDQENDPQASVTSSDENSNMPS